MVTKYTYHRNQYYQVGDVVALRDVDDGKLYYAQLRGFLTDQYCEKSAVITWLLPSASSPEVGFDPATFFLGPEEDLPRKLDCMMFVCHAPSDYFYNSDAPYRTVTRQPECGFIWTRIEYHYGPVYKAEECKMIRDQVRLAKVNKNGQEVESEVESDESQEIEIANDDDDQSSDELKNYCPLDF